MDTDALMARIRAAFDVVEYPGDDRLAFDYPGDCDEPWHTREQFRGRRDRWHLDHAMHWAGCLCHFTPEALRFYLPAFLITDLNGDDAIPSRDPVFHLHYGLTDADLDWSDGDRRGERFTAFTTEQAAALVEYLQWKDAANEFERADIEQALRNFWLARAGQTTG